MSHRIGFLAITLTVMATVFLGFNYRVAGQSQEGTNTVQWRYLTRILPVGDLVARASVEGRPFDPGSFDPEAAELSLAEDLDMRGGNGWELVTVTTFQTEEEIPLAIFFMKRPCTEAEIMDTTQDHCKRLPPLQ